MTQTYELRISGTIPDELREELGALDILERPSETVLYGFLPDQSSLFGLIARLHGLGLRLVEVRRLAGADPPDPER